MVLTLTREEIKGRVVVRAGRENLHNFSLRALRRNENDLAALPQRLQGPHGYGHAVFQALFPPGYPVAACPSTNIRNAQMGSSTKLETQFLEKGFHL